MKTPGKGCETCKSMTWSLRHSMWLDMCKSLTASICAGQLGRMWRRAQPWCSLGLHAVILYVPHVLPVLLGLIGWRKAYRRSVKVRTDIGWYTQVRCWGAGLHPGFIAAGIQLSDCAEALLVSLCCVTRLIGRSSVGSAKQAARIICTQCQTISPVEQFADGNVE